MAAFTLRRESCELVPEFNIIFSKFENLTEQRRLKTAAPRMDFKIKTPAMTKTQMQEYTDFFMTQFGALDSFNFTSPFDDQTYKVRFKENSFRMTFESGFFKGEFEFTRVFNE